MEIEGKGCLNCVAINSVGELRQNMRKEDLTRAKKTVVKGKKIKKRKKKKQHKTCSLLSQYTRKEREEKEESLDLFVHR